MVRDVMKPTGSKTRLAHAARPSFLVVLAVSLAMISSGCGNVVAEQADAVGAAAPAGDSWDPQQLSAISPVQAGPAATDGSVIASPVYQGAVVSDQQGLAVSLQPLLQLPKQARKGPYTFSISQVGAQPDQVLWHATVPQPQVRVSAGVLQQGGMYSWQATNGTGSVLGPYVMSVDAQRSGLAPGQTFGPVSVNLASGAATVGLSSRAVDSMSGKLAAALNYRPDQPAEPGLPAGWSITATGQGWSHIDTQTGGALTMVDVAGMHYAYRPTGDGHSFQPQTAAGRPLATGNEAVLVKNPDGSYTATMPSGQVSVFAAPDPQGIAQLQQTYNGAAPAPRYEMTDGKLTAITDAVSADYRLELIYQGQGECGDASNAPGLVAVPDGDLCAIRYPDGSSSRIDYVAGANGSPQIGRMVDYPDTSDSKPQVTDIGWDSAGRIVSVRGSAAANALASGIRNDPDNVVTSIGYDAAGRVASVTSPSAQAGQLRPIIDISYESGRTTLTQPQAPRTTSGFLIRHTYDPLTLLSQSITDTSGHTTTTTWDTSKDQKLTESDQYGHTKQYQYDDSGAITKVIGPFPGRKPSADSRFEQYAYDQQVDEGEPKDMHGFHVTYWDNSSLTGVPVKQEFGPEFNQHIPLAVQWNWQSSPVSGSQWGARLTGSLSIPGKGANPAPYQFSVQSSARLWINNVACQTDGSPHCTLPLAPGEYSIRIDAAVPDYSGEAVDVQWSGPGVGAQLSTIPMTAITPGYGLKSVVTKSDALGSKQAYQSVQLTQYDDPSSGSPTAAWVQQVPGQKGTSTYDSFDPDNDRWGNLSTVTRPAGNSTTYAYYGPDESVDIPCQGYGHIDQRGRSKSVDRGGQQYQTMYDDMGRTIAMQAVSATGDTHSPSCQTYNDAGQLVEESIPARGEIPAQTATHHYMVGGNPLAQSTTVSVGDRTFTSSVVSDLQGKPLQETDIWGVTRQYTYDPLTGDRLSVSTVVTPDNGPSYRSTMTNTYNPDGELTAVALDGHTLATQSVPNALGTTVTYFNGVSVHTTPSPTGSFGSQTWTTSDHKKLSYTQELASSDRVLGEQLTYPDASAQYAYTYDGLGRLTDAQLDTTLPVSARTWQYGFGPSTLGGNPKAGLNSNRTQEVVTGTAARTVNYGYDEQDQLTASDDPAIGGSINYSDLGEISQLGSLVIDYTANSQTAKLTDTATGESISYTRVGGATVEKKVSGPSGNSDTRYAAGGYLLDASNTPRMQVVELPGGAILTRQVSPELAQDLAAATLGHQTGRGQLMWTSNAAGESTGDHHLYSPYGESLLTSQTAPVVASASSPHESASPSAASSQPVLPSSPQSVATPEYRWQAGDRNETTTIGKLQIIDAGARLYVPSLGRFTSPDPVAHGSANAYDYANQDPVNQSDPTGTMPSWARLLVAGVVPLVVAVALPLAIGALGGFAGVTTATAFETIGGETIGLEAVSSLVAGIASDAAANDGNTPSGDEMVGDAMMGAMGGALGMVVGGAIAYRFVRAAETTAMASRLAARAASIAQDQAAAQARVELLASRFIGADHVIEFDPESDVVAGGRLYTEQEGSYLSTAKPSKSSLRLNPQRPVIPGPGSVRLPTLPGRPAPPVE